MEPASSEHATSAGQSPDTPFLRDDAHRDVRCDQRHRARLRTLSGPIAARVGGIDHAAAAQAAHDVLVALNPSASPMTRPLQPILRSSFRLRPPRRRDWRPSPGDPGVAANDGWVVSAFPPYAEPPLPGRCRRRRPTPPPRSPISSMPRRWRCSRRHKSCHRPRRRSRAHDTPPISTR